MIRAAVGDHAVRVVQAAVGLDGTAAPGVRRDRQKLAVKLSHDDGRSWAATRTREPGPSAYSDLAVLPDGTILCFYESGRPGATRPNSKRTDWPYARLMLARFNLEWLTAGKSVGATSP